MWVEYPDIELRLKSIRAPPTTTSPDGSEQYTLPITHDAYTEKMVAGACAIAEYLDATYPDKPTLFPKDARVATAFFDHYFEHRVVRPATPLLLAAS